MSALSHETHVPLAYLSLRAHKALFAGVAFSVAVHALVLLAVTGEARRPEPPPPVLEVVLAPRVVPPAVVEPPPKPVPPPERERTRLPHRAVTPQPPPPQPVLALRDAPEQPAFTAPAAPPVVIPPIAAPTPAPAPTPPGNEPVAKPVVRAVPPSFNAAYLRNPPPRYPLIARRNGEQGTVTLRVVVTREGTAGSVAVEKTSGSAALDGAALATVKEWRFVPAQQNGQPVEAPVLVPIVFRLQDAS